MFRSWKSIILMLFCMHSAAASEVFNLAVPEDAYPPYMVLNDSNEVVGGLLIDDLKSVLDELNIQLVIHNVPIARSRLMLEGDKMDGVMHSPLWVENPEQLLWLDMGFWVEDTLYYKNDANDAPQSLQALENSELITHMGYVYPELQPLIEQNKIIRLDQYSGVEMIQALAAAPLGSERYMVMDKNVWQWHQQRIPEARQLQESAIVVGCAPLQIRLAKNEKLERLQPLIQKRLKQRQGSMTPSKCQSLRI